MKPTVGRIVHYQPNFGAKTRVPPVSQTGPWAAIVTGIHAAGTVADVEVIDLHVFPPAAAAFPIVAVPAADEVAIVTEGAEQGPDTWRWPPRA